VARVLGGGRGVLWGDPRACGTGPDTEGGDARRPCHGHTAGIGRLQRGLGLGSAGDQGVGKREARAGGYGAVAEWSGARVGF
jgi:hypothetical protein